MTLSHERNLTAVLCIRSDGLPGDAPNEPQHDTAAPKEIQSIVSRHEGLLAPLAPGVDLAKFESAERAVECARSIVHTVRHGGASDGVRVRFGLHAEPQGSGPDGGETARHIANI